MTSFKIYTIHSRGMTRMLGIALLLFFVSGYCAAAEDIEGLRKQLQSLTDKYRNTHPDVIRLRKKIRLLRARKARGSLSGDAEEKFVEGVSEKGPEEKKKGKSKWGKYLNEDGRAILSWMESLPARKTKKVLSGQYRWVENVEIVAMTGTWPAIYEDHLAPPHKFFKGAKKNRERMLKHWDRGGLVCVHVPIPNPKRLSRQRDRDLNGGEFRSVSKDGTNINKNYKAWLDGMAVHLAWLQDRGVTVLIRPFHEMNGGWFWYGLRNPEAFKTLFRYTVTYLRKEKELKNLIIVYSASTTSNPMTYYPGGEYVDIVGLDSYNDPPVDTKVQEYYEKLEFFGKPFALTELGWTTKKYKLGKHVKDGARDIITAIKTRTPGAVWWVSWAWTNSPYRQKNLKALYNDPWVITSDEVDWREYSKGKK